MKVSRIVATLLLSVLLVSVFACSSGGGSNPTPTPTPKPSATATPTATFAYCSWTGTWNTDWGVMTFVQTGNVVTATLEYSIGLVTGTVAGNTLTGLWSVKASDNTTNSADLKLNISIDCNSFAGHWREGSMVDWAGNLSGTRAGSSVPTPTPTPTATATSVPTATPTPMPVSCSWNGTWDTEWGIMVLVKTGDHVVGNYTYQGGYIEGIVSGNTLTGTWSELPTYFPPDDGGSVVLTISNDCHSITGQWRYGFTGGCNGSWSGTWVNSSTAMPTSTPAPTVTPTPMATATPVPTATPTTTPVSCSWNGTWDTRYGTMVLVQAGDNVSGTYGSSEGRITGTVSGNKLTGNWSELPSYSPPDDAGRVELTLSANCSSFSGRWSYDSGGWASDWSGTRVY